MRILLVLPTPGTDTAVAKKTTSASTTDPPPGDKLKDKTHDELPMSVDIMCYVILGAGLLGGWLNYLRTNNTIDPATGQPKPQPAHYALLCVVGGIVAAALIPLFLKTIQSNLPDKNDGISYMVFAGFCLIAAIFSNTFIDTLSKQVFQRLNALDTKVNQVDQKASDAHDKAETADEKATDAKQTADSTVEVLTDTDPAPIAADGNERGTVLENRSPNVVTTAPSLTATAQQVLTSLTNSRSIFNSEAAIAQKTGTDPAIARTGLAELVQKGYVMAVPKGPDTVYSLKKKVQ